MSIHVDRLPRAGAPTVVLVHGTPSPPEAFRPLADRLRDRFGLLIPHLPGYGRTPGQAPSYAAKAEALEAALAEVAEQPLCLVGFSGGFGTAARLALDGRVPVAGLVGLAPQLGVTDEDAATLRGAASAVRAGQDLSAVMAARSLRPEVAAERPDLAEAVGAWVRATPADHLAEELEALADAPPLHAELLSWPGPLAMVFAEDDVAVPPSRAAPLLDARPSTHFTMLKGLGHAMWLEDLDRTAAALEEALGAVLPTNSR